VVPVGGRHLEPLVQRDVLMNAARRGGSTSAGPGTPARLARSSQALSQAQVAGRRPFHLADDFWRHVFDVLSPSRARRIWIRRQLTTALSN